MQVKVQDILPASLAICTENIDGFRADGPLQATCETFGDTGAVGEEVVGQIEQRRMMLLGHYQRMPQAHRLNIEEGDRTVVLVDHAHHFLAADDPAEDALLVRHRPRPLKVAPVKMHGLYRSRKALLSSMQGQVVASLAVALLESTRSHDRPSEVLEDEDLSVSLPRRLGLSGVVETQIQRYQAAARAGKPLPLEEFKSLLRLVLRRPDAEAILREAGVRSATRHFEKVSGLATKMVRKLPRALGFIVLARAERKLLRNITGVDRVDVKGRPLVVRLHQSPTAMLEPAGVACALYGSAFEELASLYTGKRAKVAHSRCMVNGGAICQWTLEV